MSDDYLECPCCGDDGAVSDAAGFFHDGQPLICGCSGCVSVDEDGDAWINVLWLGVRNRVDYRERRFLLEPLEAFRWAVMNRMGGLLHAPLSFSPTSLNPYFATANRSTGPVSRQAI